MLEAQKEKYQKLINKLFDKFIVIRNSDKASLKVLPSKHVIPILEEIKFEQNNNHKMVSFIFFSEGNAITLLNEDDVKVLTNPYNNSICQMSFLYDNDNNLNHRIDELIDWSNRKIYNNNNLPEIVNHHLYKMTFDFCKEVVRENQLVPVGN